MGCHLKEGHRISSLPATILPEALLIFVETFQLDYTFAKNPGLHCITPTDLHKKDCLFHDR